MNIHRKKNANKFVAHRGFQTRYPENTLLALEKAIIAGAIYVELDVQLSADRIAIIFHDKTLLRMSNLPKVIHTMNWDELKGISVHEPGRFAAQFMDVTISPLRDIGTLLSRYPHVQCFIEVKSENANYFSYEDIYCSVLDAIYEVQSQCILISFDTAFIAFAKQQGYLRLGWVLTDWQQVKQALTQATLEVVFCSTELLYKHLQQYQMLASYPWIWVVYEVANHQEAQRLFHLGIDKVETFAIETMLDAEYQS